ncbi:hypothetical protein EUGRSUZ_H01028 [Eucalyptus grandis]|uniref:Uncharacterized protein n=2 Tax=Eucalyptus grandis TaxID=71139 RepID=A0ACC3JPC0_EUCGR|nr:hypothetical protein EUGRSUZ_H01028 [Eucalyptus grandis]
MLYIYNVRLLDYFIVPAKNPHFEGNTNLVHRSFHRIDFTNFKFRLVMRKTITLAMRCRVLDHTSNKLLIRGKRNGGSYSKSSSGRGELEDNLGPVTHDVH